MSKLRHWRERWDPHADLIFLKNLLIEGERKKSGDPVTKKIRQKLGLHRMKKWWEAGYLALAPEKKKVKPLEGLAAHPRVKLAGRGWYEVTLLDGTTKKARKKELEALLLVPDSERLRSELDV